MENKLKKLRSQQGLSQEKLAELLGVSRQSIIAIESGRFNPSLQLAFSISRVFNLPIEKIFFSPAA